jgi:hypothetical protein
LAERGYTKRLLFGRAFGLADAIILIAATSTGFASHRVCTARWAGLGQIPFFRQPDLWVIEILYQIMTWVPLWLGPWTAALLILHLRRPRASSRRLVRQPGFVSSAAATSVLAAGVVAVFLVLAIRCLPTWRLAYWGAFSWPLFFHCAFDLQLPTLMGAAVAGSWLTLRLSGGWRPEPSWLDRTGRILGYIWVMLLIVNCLVGPWFYLSNHFRVPPPAFRPGVSRF